MWILKETLWSRNGKEAESGCFPDLFLALKLFPGLSMPHWHKAETIYSAMCTASWFLAL